MISQMFSSLRQFVRHRRYQKIRAVIDLDHLDGLALDLGGGPASFFADLFPRPQRIILIEISKVQALEARRRKPALRVVVADGERLPISDQAVTATICNSVIEHVSNPDLLAAEICRSSRNYFVQTPNGTFPLETYSFIAIPFYNWLPSWQWLRRAVCAVFCADFDYICSVRYLPEQHLRQLFPGSTMAYERVFGLKKSFYVYRTSRPC